MPFSVGGFKVNTESDVCVEEEELDFS